MSRFWLSLLACSPLIQLSLALATYSLSSSEKLRLSRYMPPPHQAANQFKAPASMSVCPHGIYLHLHSFGDRARIYYRSSRNLLASWHVLHRYQSGGFLWGIISLCRWHCLLRAISPTASCCCSTNNSNAKSKAKPYSVILAVTTDRGVTESLSAHLTSPPLLLLLLGLFELFERNSFFLQWLSTFVHILPPYKPSS